MKTTVTLGLTAGGWWIAEVGNKAMIISLSREANITDFDAFKEYVTFKLHFIKVDR